MSAHSVVTSAVIATLLLCYACALPVQEKGVPKVDNVTLVTTTIATPAEPTTEVKGKAEVVPANVSLNGTAPAANATGANSTSANISGDGPVPQPHNTTNLPTTSTTTTSTVAPPTTSTTTTTTTPPPKPTDPSTTAVPTTTTKPPSSTAPSKPTEAPTPAPHPNDRKFDGPSFIGGIILACGLSAIGFVGFKFYKARTEHNYHTL